MPGKQIPLEQRDKIFGEIVQQCHGSVYRICHAYLYNKSHADDLYQEIMLQVWKSLDKFKGEAKVNTWVYRIAVNTAISYNLQHKREQHSELPETVNVADEHAGAAKEKEQQFELLAKAISKLEEHDRLIISLVLEDLSYKEIAEITGSSINNIGVKISRIKVRLVKLMENNNSL